MKEKLWQHVQTVRKQSPLVHNITNYVVMNNTANALLAIGASPIMAHAKSEVNDMVSISNSLVINIGTLDEYWLESMIQAAETANNRNKPWVLDPVGAGATAFRDNVLQEILKFKPTVIRGNASEIIALAKKNSTATKGVDNTAKSTEAIDAANFLTTKYDSVVCISGESDFIINDRDVAYVNNGHELMTRVTGLGCSASAIIGAFIAVIENKQEATIAAMSLIGLAGELGYKLANGPGSLQMHLLDKLYNITEEEFYNYLKIA